MSNAWAGGGQVFDCVEDAFSFLDAGGEGRVGRGALQRGLQRLGTDISVPQLLSEWDLGAAGGEGGVLAAGFSRVLGWPPAAGGEAAVSPQRRASALVRFHAWRARRGLHSDDAVSASGGSARSTPSASPAAPARLAARVPALALPTARGTPSPPRALSARLDGRAGSSEPRGLAEVPERQPRASGRHTARSEGRTPRKTTDKGKEGAGAGVQPWVPEGLRRRQEEEQRRAKAKLAAELFEAQRCLREKEAAREKAAPLRTPRSKGVGVGGKTGSEAPKMSPRAGERPSGQTPRSPPASPALQGAGAVPIPEALRRLQQLPSVVSWFGPTSSASAGGSGVGAPLSARIQRFPLRPGGCSVWSAPAQAPAARGGQRSGRRAAAPDFEGPQGAYRGSAALETRLAIDLADSRAINACHTRTGLWAQRPPPALERPPPPPGTPVAGDKDKGLHAGAIIAGPTQKPRPPRRLPAQGAHPTASAGSGEQRGRARGEAQRKRRGRDEPEALIENCLRMISGLIEGQDAEREARAERSTPSDLASWRSEERSSSSIAVREATVAEATEEEIVEEERGWEEEEEEEEEEERGTIPVPEYLTGLKASPIATVTSPGAHESSAEWDVVATSSPPRVSAAGGGARRSPPRPSPGDGATRVAARAVQRASPPAASSTPPAAAASSPQPRSGGPRSKPRSSSGATPPATASGRTPEGSRLREATPASSGSEASGQWDVMPGSGTSAPRRRSGASERSEGGGTDLDRSGWSIRPEVAGFVRAVRGQMHADSDSD